MPLKLVVRSDTGTLWIAGTIQASRLQRGDQNTTADWL